MTEELQSIQSTIDDLRDSADDMERALNAVTEDENRLMSRVSWLEAENAKLRDELAKWERLADGIDLPEYPVTQFKPKDLERENAKLRELCEDMNKVAHMLCEAWEGSCSKEAEGMSLHAVCPIGDTSELCVFGKLHDRMRELGIGDSND
jgi:chromosome segregation ATPase